MKNKKEEIETKKQELKKLERELEEEIEKEERRKKAIKYFDDNIYLITIDDNYNIYPEDSYLNMRSNFIENYNEDNSINEHTLKECREQYFKLLKSEIDSLLDRYNESYNEYVKDFNIKVNKND